MIRRQWLGEDGGAYDFELFAKRGFGIAGEDVVDTAVGGIGREGEGPLVCEQCEMLLEKLDGGRLRKGVEVAGKENWFVSLGGLPNKDFGRGKAVGLSKGKMG